MSDSLTVHVARAYLDTIAAHNPRDDESTADALEAVGCLLRLVDQIAAEVVSDARRVPVGKRRVSVVDGATPRRALAYTDRSAFDRSTSRWSWASIGALIGVSAQAAQQRFSAPS